ncbi:hypothetical protein GCM10010372_50020 [Streptomyces tauricus]|nr:hypothetical protein GCM10010372_50020 [Streptomyces tauricus]
MAADGSGVEYVGVRDDSAADPAFEASPYDLDLGQFWHGFSSGGVGGFERLRCAEAVAGAGGCGPAAPFPAPLKAKDCAVPRAPKS